MFQISPLRTRLVSVSCVALFGAACSNTTPSPTAPTTGQTAILVTTASGGSAEGGARASNPDGSTLKVTAPGNLQPADRARASSRQPTLTWSPATGRFAIATGLTYEVEIYRENTLMATGTPSDTSYTVPSEIDYDVVYRWRVRARLGNAFGPWASTVDFVGPEAPPPPVTPPPTGGGGGNGAPFGPQRSIGINEAFQIIVNYHNAIGADLGSRSSREGRVEFLFSAVAIVAYGHPRFNPAGGDRGWCVKDAGGGRPPSDDVIVDCRSRDAWDLIGGAGANGYSFHADYIGALPGNQNVYSPPLSSLPR